MKLALGIKPLVYDANRLKTLLGTTSGGSGTGPADATYLALSLHADLSAERKFVDGDGLVATDGGANGDYTLSVDLATTSGLELTGVSPNKDLQIDDALAGDGLTIASKVLAVNTGAGLTISGDAVILSWSGVPGTIQPDASAASGSSSYAARTDHTHAIACAAPSTAVSVSSTNAEGTGTSFARADHSHAASTSSNPSGAIILAADSAGKLQLVGLGIGGAPGDAAIDIIETSIGHLRFTRVNDANYTDWNMSSNTVLETDIYNASADVYWRIKNSHASYRTHIGLNCNGDAQFDLDIGGNLRAQGWIVGKFAIQLEGALAIFHYDGPEPFETNYAGTCVGHMGQVATTSGGVIFRPGMFRQKGVQIAEGTINLHTNPSVETNTTNWTAYDVSIDRVSAQRFRGSYCLRITATGGAAPHYVRSDVTCTATTYTISCFAKKGEADWFLLYDAGDAAYHGAWFNLSTGAVGNTYGSIDSKSISGDLGNGWYRCVVTLTRTNAGSIRFNCSPVPSNGTTSYTPDSPAEKVYVDGYQCEQKSWVSPYCDGSLGLVADGAWRDGEPGTEGHYWNGTAHNSSSTRVYARVSYSGSGIMNLAEGTVSVWAQTDSGGNKSYQDLWRHGSMNYAYLSGNTLKVFYNTVEVCSSTITPGVGFHHYVFTWKDGEQKTYVDGTLTDSGTQPASTDDFSVLRVGWTGTGDTETWNGVIDDLAITDQYMDTDEIRAVYESEAPVFAESSTFQFSAGPSQLVWADHEGMWARDTAGEAALGLFCGEGTKSWGGFTMGPADLVLGANVSGSAAIHWDQSTGKFGFYGNANATVQVEIGTDGSLTAGAGVVMLDADGIDIESTTDYADLRAYTFSISGTTVSSLSAKYGATYNYIKLEAEEIADRSSHINIFSYGPNGKDSSVWLIAQADHSASVLFQSDESAGYSAIYWTTDKARLRLGDTAGAYTFSIEDSATAEVFNIDSDGDVRIGGGLYVGSVATDPAADDIWCDGYISTDGGTTKWGLGGYTGGVSTPTGYIVVSVAGTSYQLSARPS